MRRYISYLKYVIRHKWFVMKYCFKEGLYWRGIVHDLSKFLPDEFIPYAKYFYKKDGSPVKVYKEGYCKPCDTGDYEFDFAWLKHQKRNDHHWQWWILPKDEGGFRAFPMKMEPMIEMICDWRGAAKAQGAVEGTEKWYYKHRGKMRFCEATRRCVEYKLLEIANEEGRDVRVEVFIGRGSPKGDTKCSQVLRKERKLYCEYEGESDRSESGKGLRKESKDIVEKTKRNIRRER